MATEQQEILTLFIITVIAFQNLLDFFHHLLRVHRACRLHAPREA